MYLLFSWLGFGEYGIKICHPKIYSISQQLACYKHKLCTFSKIGTIEDAEKSKASPLFLKDKYTKSKDVKLYIKQNIKIPETKEQ